MKSFKREVQNILNEQRLLKEKMNSLLVCRICLTILTDQYLEITTTTFQDKTLLQLIEIVGLVAVELLEPRHVCIKCSQNLCNFYLFRKLIKSTEENLKHKQLAIIEEEGKTKCCFVDDLDEPQDDSVATTESTEPSTEYETVNIQTGLEEVTLEIKVEDEDSMDECDDNILVDSYENELETFSPAVKGEVGLETVDSYPFSPSGSQATDDEDSKQEENSDQQTNDDKLKHKCKLCDCKFQRINELWDHEKSNHADEKLKCDDCGKLFISGKSLKYHRIRIHSLVKPFMCQYCDRSYALPCFLRSHLKFQHHITNFEDINEKMKAAQPLRKLKFEKNAIIKYDCPMCKEEFYTITGLCKHLEDHHQEFTCDECDMSCSFPKQLVRHKILKHGLKEPYLCDMCGRKYAFRHELKRHKESHETEKKFMCEICSKQYTSRSLLIGHRRRSHWKQIVKCKVCGKELGKYYLPQHMEMHKPIKYPCDLCDQVYNMRTSLYEHRRKVHLGIRPKECTCDICGVVFPRNSNLVRHKEGVHLGLRYKCTICGVSYFKKHKSKVHVLRMHPDRAEDKNVVVAVRTKSELKEENTESSIDL